MLHLDCFASLAMTPSRPQFDRLGLRGTEKFKAATVPESPMLEEFGESPVDAGARLPAHRQG